MPRFGSLERSEQALQNLNFTPNTKLPNIYFVVSLLYSTLVMMALVVGILLIREQHIKFSGWVIIGPHFSRMQRNMSGPVTIFREWANPIIEMKFH